MKILYLFCCGLHALPKLNIIENNWTELVHGVYANGKQHQHVQELKNSIIN